MLTIKEAKQLVYDKFNKYNSSDIDNKKLIITKIVEENFGWIFFYATLGENDKITPLLGNAPLIVDKKKKKVIETGTAYSPQYYIEEYQKENGYSQEFKDLSNYDDNLKFKNNFKVTFFEKYIRPLARPLQKGNNK